MQKTFNLSDYKVTEISKEFSLRFIGSDVFQKVVTSSTAVVDGNFMILCYTGSLGVWKMGDDETWTDIDYFEVDDEIERLYCDVVFYKGKFYAVKCNGIVSVIDSSSFTITENLSAIGRVCFGRVKHLVVSFGELFLLERCYNEEMESDNEYHSFFWKVQKLNEENNELVLVNSLGDRASSVGRYDCSFSVSARDFPGCKGNSIYFADRFFDEKKGDIPDYDGGIYDLEDGSVGPLSAFPDYSKIFWPPATWLKPNPLSSSASK